MRWDGMIGGKMVGLGWGEVGWDKQGKGRVVITLERTGMGEKGRMEWMGWCEMGWDGVGWGGLGGVG